MFSSTRVYIYIVFAVLLASAVTSRDCSFGFRRAPNDPAHSLCSDRTNTYSYANGDCKPFMDPKKPPAGSSCQRADPNLPNFKNGNCPSYMGLWDYKKNQLDGFSCNLMIKKGATIEQDKYGKYNCKLVTNLINCKGDGKFMSKTPTVN
ncbi:secreted protein [Melampsora americana]|nr:secreted protein [Melampsora americana]